MTAPTRQSLVERLQAASGPNFDLEREIMYWAYGTPESLRSPLDKPSPYTASIDAAARLVKLKLPGCCLAIGQSLHHKHWHARLSDLEDGAPITLGEADHATPAIALCLALLKALESTEPKAGQENAG